MRDEAKNFGIGLLVIFGLPVWLPIGLAAAVLFVVFWFVAGIGGCSCDLLKRFWKEFKEVWL